MKRIVFAALLSVIYYNSSAQGYTIKLDLNNASDARFVLSYTDNGKRVIDTISKGEFKGSVTETTLAYLTNIDPKLGLQLGDKAFLNSPDLIFFITNETILIKGNAEKIYLSSVTGGQANHDWSTISSQVMMLEGENWEGLKNAYTMLAKGDSAALKSYREKRGGIGAKKDSIETSFIKSHPESVVSMILLSLKSTSMPIERLEAAYNKLSDQYKTTAAGKIISDKIKATKAVSIGKMAENFSKNDHNGNRVSLHSLRGQFVLLDFWGSWCLPCRKSHPHLKVIYDKYKDRGLEIMGIAFEHGRTLAECKKSWNKAIVQDGIQWINVLSNDEEDTYNVVRRYGINSFPTKILLDKTGKIIGIYDEKSEAELDKKLAEIFDGKVG